MMLTLLLAVVALMPGHDPRPRVRRSEATREPTAGRRPAAVRRHRAERHRARRGDLGGRALRRSRPGVGRRGVHRRGAAGECAGGDPAGRRGVRRRRRDRLPQRRGFELPHRAAWRCARGGGDHRARRGRHGHPRRAPCEDGRAVRSTATNPRARLDPAAEGGASAGRPRGHRRRHRPASPRRGASRLRGEHQP